MPPNSKPPTIDTNHSEPFHPYSHPQFVTAYGPHLRQKLTFALRDRTQQQFKDECDVNVIMRNYEVSGQLTHLAKKPLMWGDAPDLDFQGAMNQVVEARERFMDLPAKVRDRFNNDPGALLAFLGDEANRDEAEKLGLVNPVAGSARAAKPADGNPTGGDVTPPPSDKA